MKQQDAYPSLLTVITATYNRSEWLPKAIESVGRYPGLEHIVIDGGSTDRTLEVLSHYPHLKVISEPDGGVYDAWNKGISLAEGRYIAFLNSDDMFCEGATERILSEISAMDKDGAQVLATGFEVVDSEGHESYRVDNPEFLRLSPAAIGLGAPAINARIFHSGVFEIVGLFDTVFRTASDTEFLLRCCICGLSSQFLEFTSYRYVRHEGSITLSAQGLNQEARSEVVQIIDRYARAFPLASDRADLRMWKSNVLFGSVWSRVIHGAWPEALRALNYAFCADPLWWFRISISILKGRFRGRWGMRWVGGPR